MVYCTLGNAGVKHVSTPFIPCLILPHYTYEGTLGLEKLHKLPGITMIIQWYRWDSTQQPSRLTIGHYRGCD